MLIRVSRIANGTAFHDVALTLVDNLLAKEYHARSFSGMAFPPLSYNKDRPKPNLPAEPPQPEQGALPLWRFPPRNCVPA
jgi:hypothetical protein